MTRRAIAIGILLALFISVVVYFNDEVIRQTFLVGNHFPVVVFGTLILLLIFVNPLLRLVRFVKPLGGKEIAIIGALGLAACGWPGSGFFRTFTSLVAMPTNYCPVQSSWQATHVMSYVPGVSSQLAEGHILDWNGLVKELALAAGRQETSAQRRIGDMLPPLTRALVLATAAQSQIENSNKVALLSGFNDLVSNPHLYNEEAFKGVAINERLCPGFDNVRAGTASQREVEQVNRFLLVAVFPGKIAPAPQGKGLLLADGDMQSPALRMLQEGSEIGKTRSIFGVPWKIWLPTISFYGGLAILIGLAVACLAVIFLPQWKRELLPFPIAQFITDLGRGDAGGSPSILGQRMFWYAFGAMLVLHLVNGIGTWFPSSIQIPMTLDFSALQQLFPRARQLSFFFQPFTPTLYPTVIAIATFLSADVSFSMGIAPILFAMAFSILLTNGVALNMDWLDSGNQNVLIFGAYIGIALMLFYVGRRYYLNLLGSSIGLTRRHSETPNSSVWAARFLFVCIALSVALMARGGVDWFFGIPLVLLLLLMFSVMSRINAEAGAFYVQPTWMPLGMMAAMVGMPALGPTGYVAMAMICLVIAVDPREAIMPFVINALHMAGGTEDKSRHGRFALLIGVLIAATFFVALGSTLYFQYNKGVNQDYWATVLVPKMPFDRLAYRVTELSHFGDLAHSVGMHGLQRLGAIHPDYNLLVWLVAGLVLVIACSLLRMQFSWWPLHPIAFVVWGTVPATRFYASFLIGWAIKVAVMKLAGKRGFLALKPAMFGLIAGELFAALGWNIFGAIYYLITNITPQSYMIFPG